MNLKDKRVEAITAVADYRYNRAFISNSLE